MFTDYHCHLLPAMDDGAKDLDIAVRMLAELKSQGVERVVATPHYYGSEESVERFLSRRKKTLAALCGGCDASCVLPGAEVAIKKGISKAQSLEMLVMGGSRYILLELPYMSLADWMIDEIYNIAYGFGLTPVIAHADRYLQWYGRSEMSRILSLQDAVIQINNHALQKRQSLKFVLEVIRLGLPVVFGSDAHNLDGRAPDSAVAIAILRSKLDKFEFSALMERNKSLLSE